MKKTILTNNTVSNKTTNKKMKGINTMKKLIVATCLIVGAAFASFAGVIYNDLGLVSGDYLKFVSFTFTSDGSYGLEFGTRDGGFQAYPSVSAFGYYYINGPEAGVLKDGILLGNNSDYFNPTRVCRQ